MNPEDFLPFLIENALSWVKSQRDTHRPDAKPLSEEERSELSRFFGLETLNRTRIKIVKVIENPEFFTEFPKMGLPDPMDFRSMSGITYVDTILISKLLMPTKSHWMSLLFHEMVHVVQYEVLGLEGFMDHYVRGWTQNGFDYFSIPLERDAYELQRRYDEAPREAFSVVAEVIRDKGVIATTGT